MPVKICKRDGVYQLSGRPQYLAWDFVALPWAKWEIRKGDQLWLYTTGLSL